MNIDRNDIIRLKELYVKHYNIVLSDEEANERGQQLTNLIKIIGVTLPYETNSETESKR